MQDPVPTIRQQKRLEYRLTLSEAKKTYRLINRDIFDNALAMPRIEVMARCRKYWGMCYGSYEPVGEGKSMCEKIRLMDKFYCRQWMVTILAHEMCHQYQWDVLGPQRLEAGKERIMTHGPSFFLFRDKMAEHGITLKKWHRRNKWFITQSFR